MSLMARVIFLAWCLLPYHALAQTSVAQPTQIPSAADASAKKAVFGSEINWSVVTAIIVLVGGAIWLFSRSPNR